MVTRVIFSGLSISSDLPMVTLLFLLLLLGRLVSPHGLVVKEGAARPHHQYGCYFADS
jgi:hypothetical protein